MKLSLSYTFHLDDEEMRTTGMAMRGEPTKESNDLANAMDKALSDVCEAVGSSAYDRLRHSQAEKKSNERKGKGKTSQSTLPSFDSDNHGDDEDSKL